MSGAQASIKSLVAYEKVRDLILSGTKLPGTRLVLSELEEELGISKGPLREALMRLDRTGLVRNLPYKGCVVAAPPKLEEIHIMYEMRVNLECRLAKEALRRITKTQLSRLEAIVESSKKITQTGDLFFTNNRTFHAALCEASGMAHLSLIVDRLLEVMEVFMNLYQYESSDCTVYHDDHALIIQALKDKDEEQLDIILRRNIGDGLMLVRKVVTSLKPNE